MDVLQAFDNGRSSRIEKTNLDKSIGSKYFYRRIILYMRESLP